MYCYNMFMFILDVDMYLRVSIMNVPFNALDWYLYIFIFILKFLSLKLFIILYILELFLGSILKIFIISKLILTISHNIIVPNTKGPFSLVLIYNIINLSTFKLKFHKTVIIHKCETTFMKTTLLNAYESQAYGKPHD